MQQHSQITYYKNWAWEFFDEKTITGIIEFSVKMERKKQKMLDRKKIKEERKKERKKKRKKDNRIFCENGKKEEKNA